MCGVGVVVDTAVEDGRSVLANTRANQSLATWMFLDKVGHIVNHASNCNKSTAILRFGLIGVPVNDWELLQRNTPVESLSLLVKLLLELLETALLNLILLELLEIVGETELLPEPDGPFRRVILMPFDGITVVGREFVVEVVITLSKRNESSNDVVTRRVAVIEGLITKPVGQGVDAESGLLNKEDSENTGVNESTGPVSPTETSNEAREDHAHENDRLDIVSVLPDNDRVVIQIRNVGTADAFGVLLHDHPPKMRVNEAFSDGVRILVRVGISVMRAMISGPPSDRTFDGSTSHGGEKDLQR